jgi:ABC-type sugar transport system ATPase subunit
VHGLLGENGSGKSSLLSILSGQIPADDGEILLEGDRVQFRDAPDALEKGIAMVSQETAVAPNLSVAENVMLGRLPRNGARGVDMEAAAREAWAILDRLGLDLDPWRLVGSLPPDHRQMVEIARALAADPRVLILDEPTSSLTEDEVEAVLEAILLLKQQDVATLIVSHRLRELFAVIDEATILRDGQMVATGRREGFTMQSMVATMLDTDQVEAGLQTAGYPIRVSGDRPANGSARDTARPPALRMSGASSGGFSDLDLELRPGEILGLAGLVGSGRRAVLRAIFGLDPLLDGSMELDGRPYAPATPGQAVSAGIGYVPPDRKTDGLVLTMSVRENLEMVATARARSWPMGKGGAKLSDLLEIMRRLNVRESALHAPAGTLSGGNQQKIALAKWLAARVGVLLLAEPTRGVDVGSRAQIHSLLRGLADEGVAVLISSSETTELLEVCDRITVLFANRTVGTFNATETNEAEITHACSGQVEGAAA